MQKQVEKDIVVDGELLHYYEAKGVETEHTDTIVFLHGWGSNSTLWFSSTLPLIEHGYRLIFVDLPGFGKSQNPRQSLHLEDYAKTISRFIQKLEITNPIVVGHSFGGKVATRIASRKMIPLHGLVLVDASGLAHTSRLTKTKIQIAKTIGPLFRLPILKDFKAGLLRLSGSDDYVAFPALKETFVNIIREHVEDELSHINTSTLVVWGANDSNSYTPVHDAAVFHKKIVNSGLHIIKSAGHYVFLDQPNEFLNVLLSFLKGINGKS